MRRQPSIHIKESDLVKILKDNLDDPENGYIEELSERILKEAKKYSITNRTIVTLKKEGNRKKAGKISMANEADTKLMGKTINSYRIKLKHKGVRPIKESSREWSILKELTSLVIQFCNDFELEKVQGMKEFTRISLKHLSKGSKSGIIGKMINTFDKVVDIYDGKIQMQDDDDPKLTEKLYNKYRILIVKCTGIKKVDFDKEDVLPYFFIMKQLAEEMGVSPFTYLDAQFDQLKWTGSYPNPDQLINDKSKQRLYKYRYEADNDIGLEPGPDENLVEQLIKIRK